MSRIKSFQSIPILRVGISLSLGVLMAVTILILFSGPSMRPQVKAASPPVQLSGSATIPVSYTLDDFDVQQRLNNDFFGHRGRWESGGAIITDSIVCPVTYTCYLSLAYDLSSPGTEGGYWEEFSYSYTTTWPLRDLREFEQFRFRVQGDSKAPGFPDQFQIEFIGRDWGARAVFSITGVTTSWQWKTITLTDAGAFDWSDVKHVAIKLVGDQMTAKRGRLLFDDFTLVDQNFSGDLLDLISQRAFRYFWENRHPQMGFVRDRAVDPFYDRNVTSVAAVGFELAAFGIGAEHGWISRTEAALATRQVISNLLTLPQGPVTGTGASGYKGFFYHLLDISTGLRVPDSEVSTIDSALLLAGVLFARQYYTGTNQTEIDIQSMADQLYNRVEWDWVLRTDPQPSNKTNQFYMAWKPEYHDCEESNYTNCYEIPDTKSGYGYFSGKLITGTVPITDPLTWDYYTDEILLINLLAIGSPTHSVPTDTSAWTRQLGTYDGYTFYQSWFGQLFAHFIGQVWLDLRFMGERNSPHINWWLNSQKAALANRQFTIDNAITCSTYSTLSWGLSTCLGPPDNPTAPTMDGVGVYRGYGALPKGDPSPPFHDCTLAPYAAASSIIFLSENPVDNEAYQALDHWFYTQPRLWGLYGFRDGFNLNQSWYAHDYIGIDQGTTLLALENYRTRLIWSKLRRDPAIERAIGAVFVSYRSYLPAVLK